MLKYLAFLAPLVLAVVGCGPSAAEKDAQRKVEDERLQQLVAAEERATSARQNERAAMASSAASTENSTLAAQAEAERQRRDAAEMAKFAKMPEGEAKAIMQGLVANLLKDPAAAQFRNVQLKGLAQGKAMCGEINAKNSYGGYVGFRPFAVHGTTAVIEFDPRTCDAELQCLLRSIEVTHMMKLNGC
jgi:hypothetical protein